MLEEEGRVVSISEGSALVALIRSEACAGCSSRGACREGSGREMRISVADPVGVRPGDRVVVAMPPAALLKAGFAAYLLPAVLLVAGAALGWSRTGTDLGTLAGGGLGLLLGAAILALSGRRRGPEPRITRVVG